MKKKQLYLLAGGILAATAVIYFIRKKKSNQEPVNQGLPERSNVGVYDRAQMLSELEDPLLKSNVKIANEQTYIDYVNRLNQ